MNWLSLPVPVIVTVDASLAVIATVATFATTAFEAHDAVPVRLPIKLPLLPDIDKLPVNP